MRPLLILAAACLLALPARAAEPSWVQVDTDHFSVLSESGEHKAREVALYLERMRSTCRRMYPNIDAPSRQVTVLALSNGEYDQVDPAQNIGARLWSSGAFEEPDEPYMLVRTGRLLDQNGTLRRILMYQVQEQIAPATPFWLREGLSILVEQSELHSGYTLVGRRSLDDVYYLRDKQLLPLESVLGETSGDAVFGSKQYELFEAESWALSHMLLMADWGKPQSRLDRYQALLAEGLDLLPAATQAFGSLDQLQRDLMAYINGADFKAIRVPTKNAEDTAATARPITAAHAHAVLAHVLIAQHREADAEHLLAIALAEDATEGTALSGMGKLRFHQHDAVAARSFFEKAVQRDPDSAVAHYGLAISSLQAEGPKAASAQNELRTAIRLNPAYSAAYDALATLLADDPSSRQEAHLANLHAIALRPTSLRYRLHAAEVLIKLRQCDAAGVVLEQARLLARSPEQKSAWDATQQRLSTARVELR